MIEMATLELPPFAEPPPLAPLADRLSPADAIPAAPKTGRLGDDLLRAGLITAEQLQEALRRQSTMGMRLGAALVELGFVTEEDIFPFVAQRLGVPCVQLRDGLVDPLAARLIPRSRSETLDALALFKVRKTLCVAMSDPLNLRSTDTIERITGLKVRPVVAHSKSIQRMIQRVYDENFHVDAVTADMEESAVEISDDAVQIDLYSAGQAGESSPIVNLVNFLIMQALRHKASDIHIEPGRRHTTVRFRVDGQLREVLRPRRDLHPALISRIKVIAKMDIAEHRLPQDGRVHVVVDRREIDLRVSVLPTVLGEKVVIRVLDRQRLTFDLDKLGFSPRVLPEFKRLLAKPHGLLLVTGPTGSGKTTTLYSAIELIKSVHTNIVTVEDPVEYQLELINQVMVDEATSLTFPKALRSILRQDPDVVMVGEIRDPETANVAVQAALTGHLVLSTLHTNDSSGAVVRLLDMGVASFKVAAALIGVLAQRLVRGVCPDCKTTYYPPRELLEAIGYKGDARRSFIRGQGCSQCHDTGCRGRTGIYELLTCDGAMRKLIAEEASLADMRNHLRTQNMPTLFDQALELAEAGETSLDEAVRIAFFE
ncbi:MAG: GspE/PulE family protein [Thermoguttaceae bacterium]